MILILVMRIMTTAIITVTRSYAGDRKGSVLSGLSAGSCSISQFYCLCFMDEEGEARGLV